MRLFKRGEESSSSLDLLVVGLGNPGREHAQNRHNAGWMVIDELARRHGGSFKGKFSGQLAEVRDGDLRLGLLKPELYMNLSGRSVAPAVRFFKVPPEQLLVVHGLSRHSRTSGSTIRAGAGCQRGSRSPNAQRTNRGSTGLLNRHWRCRTRRLAALDSSRQSK